MKTSKYVKTAILLCSITFSCFAQKSEKGLDATAKGLLVASGISATVLVTNHNKAEKFLKEGLEHLILDPNSGGYSLTKNEVSNIATKIIEGDKVVVTYNLSQQATKLSLIKDFETKIAAFEAEKNKMILNGYESISPAMVRNNTKTAMFKQQLENIRKTATFEPIKKTVEYIGKSSNTLVISQGMNSIVTDGGKIVSVSRMSSATQKALKVTGKIAVISTWSTAITLMSSIFSGRLSQAFGRTKKSDKRLDSDRSPSSKNDHTSYESEYIQYAVTQ